MKAHHGEAGKIVLFIAIFLAILLSPHVQADISAAEHASHHPGPPDGAGPPAGVGGMGNMGEMMKKMGKVPQKEFYSSLMDLPKLSNEQRAVLQERAHDRMKSGTELMNRGIVDLTNGAETNDNKKMESATSLIREGLNQFESGVSTHRELAEGKSPLEIGTNWFKRTMSIGPYTPDDSENLNSSISIFHLFLMIFLISFAVIMIAMYFYKMRRAAKLLEQLGGKASPAAPLKTVVTGRDLATGGDAGPLPPSIPPAVAPPTIAATPTLVRNQSVAVPTQWKGKLKVIDIIPETPKIKTFRFANPDGGDLPFTYQAGQFLTLGVSVANKPVKRSYSIGSHPCEHDALELTIKREDHGLVSRYMHDVVREGDVLDAESAHGNLTLAGLGEEPIVLLGGGVGIVPLMSVIRCMISCGMKNPIYLLYACKSLTDFVYRDELEALRKRHANFKMIIGIHTLTESFLGAFEGRLTKEKIEKFVPEIAKARIHICGPSSFMESMKKIVIELQVPETQVKMEAFGAANPVPKAIAPTSAAIPPTSETDPAAKSVTFKKAGKTVPIPPDRTVLELSEDIGINLPFSCRVGTCGVCKLKLLSGEVDMEVQDALSEDDKRQGIILTCQAKAKTNLEIEEP